MILFTGHGDIASHFSKKYPCEVQSLRNKSIAELESLLPGYDVVIHNAANLKPQNVAEAVNDNFILTKKIIDTLGHVNANAKFIYLSSMSMLKNENEYLDPLQMTPYAFSKYLGELYTLTCAIKNTAVVRFSTIFYENPAKDGLSNLLSTAFQQGKITTINNGTAKRDFIPIEILTRYLYKLCTSGTNAQLIYNVCSGTATSFAEVVNLLKLRLPHLVVENNQLENATDVLCDFSTTGLQSIGVEAFDLSDYINTYLNKLSTP